MSRGYLMKISDIDLDIIKNLLDSFSDDITVDSIDLRNGYTVHLTKDYQKSLEEENNNLLLDIRKLIEQYDSSFKD